MAPIRVLELRSVRGTGGGPEKTILYGARRSDPARYDVTVCYVRDARDEIFGPAALARTVGVRCVEVVERHSFDRAVLGQIEAVVRQRGIDIVHAHDYKTDALALWLARATPVHVVSTAHGWTGHSLRERLLYYPADKRLLARFPRVIAVSTEIKRELIRHHARPERITVVLNGIDHERFARDRTRMAAARATLGLGPRHVVIGSVGRLERQKRFDLLLRAFERLWRRDRSLRLVIAGDGSLRDVLPRLAHDLGIQQACRFTGHLKDVGQVHHALDLFVQSSEYEGTPNAVLEAMAFETPVVATDAGGTAELITDGVHGRIVPSRAVDALANTVREVIDDRTARQRYAAAARRRVERELSFRARMRRVEAIYDDIAGRVAASPESETTCA